MRSWTRAVVSLALAAASLIPVAAAGAAPPPFAPAHGYYKHVCGAVSGPQARCDAEVVTDALGEQLTNLAHVSGYGPDDLASAYGLASAGATAGTGQTVAIVDAYDAPNAEADLAT